MFLDDNFLRTFLVKNPKDIFNGARFIGRHRIEGTFSKYLTTTSDRKWTNEQSKIDYDTENYKKKAKSVPADGTDKKTRNNVI